MGEINSRIILTEGKKDDTVHPTSEGIRRFSIEFLEETIRVWQSYSSHPLSLEDAEEIAENMVDLILFINELGEEEE